MEQFKLTLLMKRPVKVYMIVVFMKMMRMRKLGLFHRVKYFMQGILQYPNQMQMMSTIGKYIC